MRIVPIAVLSVKRFHPADPGFSETAKRSAAVYHRLKRSQSLFGEACSTGNTFFGGRCWACWAFQVVASVNSASETENSSVSLSHRSRE